MATTLKQIMDRLPADRRRRVEARAEALIAEEMSLRELRKRDAQDTGSARAQDRQACPGEGRGRR